MESIAAVTTEVVIQISLNFCMIYPMKTWHNHFPHYLPGISWQCLMVITYTQRKLLWSQDPFQSRGGLLQ